MPLLSSDYRPSPWMRNGHISTIYAALLRRVPNPGQQRERLELEDGDFLDLDWSYASKVRSKSTQNSSHGSQNKHIRSDRGAKALVLIHGLEGNAQRPYMLGSAAVFQKAGFDVCSVNLRGCSGMPNRLYRSYHSGATEDLNAVLKHLGQTKGYEEIYLKGFSLGGNLILKFLGETWQTARYIRAAVAVSVPCDLHDSLQQLNMSKNQLYARRFLRNLKGKLRQKQRLFPDLISDAMIQKVRTLKDFDDLYTSQAHGFRDALDYYARCSSLEFLSGIRVPTLLLNAANDSFLGPSCYPEAMAQSQDNLFFESPVYGGHVGFHLGGGVYYNELRALEFIEGVKREEENDL